MRQFFRVHNIGSFDECTHQSILFSGRKCIHHSIGHHDHIVPGRKHARILYDLLEKDFLPVIAPIGLDDDYNTYNINADDAACAIARAMRAEKLAFLTDIEGVYKDPKDPETLISELKVSEARALMDEGYIGGGMLPKLYNCVEAIEHGVSRVHILDGRIPHCLLLEIFTNKGIGTAILNDGEPTYYRGEE